ncbi:MAG: hypothetical protein M1832_005594 [Thelocarpon impressellum]|nr:MAG: hypothetical protein M1832_005594 [Thelocarpon impressellum]
MMVGTSFGTARKQSDPARPSLPLAGSGNDFAYSIGAMGPPPTANSAVAAGGAQNPYIVYQHIHDIASKRISTLDYLRKAHEGRVYWFNTLLFTKPDLQKLSYFDPKRLSRRATNFLLLGLSLPTILDVNSTNSLEYLRALNALLLEFEAYQQIHPADGSSASSLSRARIPAMFKRAAHSTTSKSRRTSSATEIGLPMNSASDPSDLKSMTGTISSAGGVASSTVSVSSFPTSDQELLPGEEYTHLLTPSLPFDPDFYETFATLCDVLIDCYTRAMTLISSPLTCTPGVGEMFHKVDARVRKIIVVGVVKDFEEASRAGAKSEVAGVGKVVLGGLL